MRTNTIDWRLSCTGAQGAAYKSRKTSKVGRDLFAQQSVVTLGFAALNPIGLCSERLNRYGPKASFSFEEAEECSINVGCAMRTNTID